MKIKDYYQTGIDKIKEIPKCKYLKPGTYIPPLTIKRSNPLKNNPLTKVFYQGNETILQLNDIKAAHLMPALDKVLKEVKSEIKNVLKLKNPTHSFEEVIKPLGEAFHKLDAMKLSLEAKDRYASNDTEYLEALKKVKTKVNNFLDKEFYSKAVAQKVKKVSEKYSENTNELTKAQKIYLNKLVDKFKMKGAYLSPNIKKQIKKIKEEIVNLELDFQKNASRGVNIKLDNKDIEIGNEIYFDELLRETNKPDDRKKIYQSFVSRTETEGIQNTNILEKITRLRQKLASLYGSNNFADYKGNDWRIINDSNKIENILLDLAQKLKPIANEEKNRLLGFANEQKISLLKTGKLAISDYEYLKNKYQESLGFKEESMKPYLRIDKSVENLWKILKDLYDIDIQKLGPEAEGLGELWDPSVELYQVKSQGKELGKFYLDLYTYPGKYQQGAWFTPMGLQHPDNPKPMGILSLTVDPKSTHFKVKEQRILYHEAGHMLQTMLAEPEFINMHGFNIKKDFIEFMSQLNERWAYTKEALTHEDTNDSISEEILEQYNKVNNPCPAIDTLTNIQRCLLDLRMHQRDKYKDDTIQEIYHAIDNEFSIFDQINTTDKDKLYFRRAPGEFRHMANPLYTGAGYFGYLHSQILTGIAKNEFKDNAFSKEKALKLKNTILKPAAGVDPAEALNEFTESSDSRLDIDGFVQAIQEQSKLAA